MTDKFSLRYVVAVLAWVVLHVWPGALPRWMFWILPATGDYAYWDDPSFVEHRRDNKGWRRWK